MIYRQSLLLYCDPIFLQHPKRSFSFLHATLFKPFSKDVLDGLQFLYYDFDKRPKPSRSIPLKENTTSRIVLDSLKAHCDIKFMHSENECVLSAMNNHIQAALANPRSISLNQGKNTM